jgi:protein-S-isoprenylcysteine O-methyltransferase Ste14
MTTAGLYKIVRHPIYLGYCVSAIGICFILPKTVYIVLSLVIISFNLYRAVLEESKLLSAYPEYKIYADSTPFILPFKIRGKHAHSN